MYNDMHYPKVEYDDTVMSTEMIAADSPRAVWEAARLIHSHWAEPASSVGPKHKESQVHQLHNIASPDIAASRNQVYQQYKEKRGDSTKRSRVSKPVAASRCSPGTHGYQQQTGASPRAEDRQCRKSQNYAAASNMSGPRSHAGQTAPHGKPQPRASQNSKGTGKRKRDLLDEGDRPGHNEDQGSDEQDDPDENDVSDTSSRHASKLLACHFHKRDPLKFRGPGKFKACQNGFQGFNRLKQHLRTVHQPKSYCVGCGSVFDSQDEKDNHDRTRGECERRQIETKVNTLDEMITSDRQREALKRKLVSVSTSTHWFAMWKSLNGNLPPPASPYKESPLDAMEFINFVRQRKSEYARGFAQEYVQNNQGASLVQLLNDFGHSLLERATVEFLQQNTTDATKLIAPPPALAHRTVQVDTVNPSIQGSEPIALQQVSLMAPSMMDPVLSPTIPVPAIVVSEGADDHDFFNTWDSMIQENPAYFVTEDPMLGNIYRSPYAQWILPSSMDPPTLN